MHVGIANERFILMSVAGKRSRHSRCMRNPQFYLSGKRPMCHPKLLHLSDRVMSRIIPMANRKTAVTPMPLKCSFALSHLYLRCLFNLVIQLQCLCYIRQTYNRLDIWLVIIVTCPCLVLLWFLSFSFAIYSNFMKSIKTKMNTINVNKSPNHAYHPLVAINPISPSYEQCKRRPVNSS